MLARNGWIRFPSLDVLRRQHHSILSEPPPSHGLTFCKYLKGLSKSYSFLQNP